MQGGISFFKIPARSLLLTGMASAVFFPLPGQAVTCQVDFNQNSVTFSPQMVLENRSTRIYAILTANCSEDMEGTMKFYDQGSLISTKPFSLRANGRPEEVWATWLPRGTGDHEIAVEVMADGDSPASFTNRRVSLPVAVEKDADGDGIPDRLDSDMDNDGISNVDEARIGTDPLRLDTDGDGADDKNDAFPLDPNRRAVPTPPPTPPTVTPPSSQKTTTPPPATRPASPTPSPRPAAPTTRTATPSTQPSAAVSSSAALRPAPTGEAQVLSASGTGIVAATSSVAVSSTEQGAQLQPSSTTGEVERWSVPTSTHVVAMEPSLPQSDTRNPLTTHILLGVAAVTALSGIAFFILSARA